MPPRNLPDLLALNLLPYLGPIAHRRLLERFQDPRFIAYRLPAERLGGYLGLKPERVSKIRSARKDLKRRVEHELRQADKLGLRLLTVDDTDYPAILRELPDSPIVLYVRGDLPQARLRVAVIGSRQATAYGRRVAAGIASGLAARGIEVVSGGARGIDTCAHLGALDESGRTVAVIGSGFLHPYPEENAELFERIAASGAMISEFAVDHPPHPGNFPRRNRLISGLSAAVVVVEAALRSGSLVTAGHALEQGREVLAVPGPVSSIRSQGCHRLIQQGARLVQNIDDVLEELSPMYRGAIEEPSPVPNKEGAPETHPGKPDELQVLELLDEVEACHLDRLADRAPFGIARLQAALFGLELEQRIESLPGGYYVLRPGRIR